MRIHHSEYLIYYITFALLSPHATNGLWWVCDKPIIRFSSFLVHSWIFIRLLPPNPVVGVVAPVPLRISEKVVRSIQQTQTSLWVSILQPKHTTPRSPFGIEPGIEPRIEIFGLVETQNQSFGLSSNLELGSTQTHNRLLWRPCYYR